MQDRELLELAAKAAGLQINRRAQAERDALIDPTTASLWINSESTAWNPLRDNGPALRLAVKLNIRFSGEWNGASVALHGVQEFHESNGDDPCAATRRAIVRAAAEIGKATP